MNFNWLINFINKDKNRIPDDPKVADTVENVPVIDDPIFHGETYQNADASGWESTTIMDTKTVELCQALSVDKDAFEKSQKSWLDDLDKYAQEYKRLIYSQITSYVYNLAENDEKTYDIFAYNLRRTYDSVAKTAVPEDSPDRENFLRLRSYVTKFYDHVNLAYSQFTVLYMEKEKVDQIVEDRLRPALTETTTNLTSQLVGLVALFTALSFIVFGGISSLNSISSVLTGNKHAVLPTIIVAIVWAFCMMNLLFLFMYFVLQIMGTKKEDSIKALVQKHPLIFICNYILLALLLFLGAAHYAWITGIGRGIYDWVLSISDWAFILGFALIAGIIFFSGRLLYKALTPPKK